MLPKYFDSLHLAINAVTGQPIIGSFKNKPVTDKQKTIPGEEWESAILNFFNHFDSGKTYVQALKSGTFCIAGKFETPKQTAEFLRNIVTTMEKMESWQT